MKILKIVIAGMIAGTLSACGPQRGEGSLISNPFTELHEQFQGTFLEARTKPGKWRAPQDREWQDSGIKLNAGESQPVPAGEIIVATQFHGALPLRDMERYLTGVLDKLAAHSPVSDIDYKVRIVGDGYYGKAQAMPDGTIAVPLAFLANAESEDEVAWLLGHELSHLIMEHHDIDWIKDFQSGLAGMARNTLRGAQFASKQLQQMSGGQAQIPTEKVARIHGMANLMFEATTGGALPAWQREQEDAADLLGTDLVVKAGYNPEVGINVIHKIGEAANEEGLRQQRQQAAQEQMKSEMEALQADWSMAGMVEVFGGQVERIWRDFWSESKRVHRDSIKRKANLEVYLDTRYAEVDRDNNTRAWQRAWKGSASARVAKAYEDVWKSDELLLQNNPDAAERAIRKAIGAGLGSHSQARLSFYRVRLLQGKQQLARKNLELAIRPGAISSLEVYREYANLLISQNELETAAKVTDKAWEKYREPVQLYPLRVQLAMMNGESSRAIGLASECSTRAYSMADDCDAALKSVEGLPATAAGKR